YQQPNRGRLAAAAGSNYQRSRNGANEMTPRPTHLFRHEHRVIEQALRALDGMCFRLQAGDDIPVEALAQALDFVQNYADRFHHFREEEYLFPALKQCGLEEGGALHFLCDEHELERELLAELEFAIEEYRYGDSDAVRRFVEIMDRFRKHLIGHMQKEDTLLFRMAEDLLDDDAKNALMRNLAVEGVSRKYERLAADLEKAWAI
ncbi:MAG TPA: hemerythrin domain-containing protein, partial [Blastocatellia bacterium]